MKSLFWQGSRRLFLVGVVHLYTAVLVLLASACRDVNDSGEAKKPRVVFAPVVQGDVFITTEFIGQTMGSVDIDIRARVEGELLGIHFTEGGSVKSGDLLYTIDSQPFELKVIEAQSQLAEAKTKWAAAEVDLKRIRPLAEMNAVSRRDLDAAQARAESAKAVADAAQAALELAEIERGYTKITAPVSGLIGISKAKVGDLVGKEPNAVVLATISQIDPIHVGISLPEKEYLRLARMITERDGAASTKNRRDRAPVKLYLADGSLHPHGGVLHAVDSQVDSQTGTLTIELAFPNPELILRSGQFAKIEAVLDKLENAMLLPQRAVQELQGSFQVYVINDEDIVEVRGVKLGPKSGTLWVIEEGLVLGDRVIVDGFQRVRPGVQVEAAVVKDDVGDNYGRSAEE